MAKIWFAKQGEWPTDKSTVHESAFPQCTTKLGPLCFLCELPPAPRVKDDDERLAQFKDSGFVLIEGGEDELKGSLDWRPGYYVSSFHPEEAKKRLAEKE